MVEPVNNTVEVVAAELPKLEEFGLQYRENIPAHFEIMAGVKH